MPVGFEHGGGVDGRRGVKATCVPTAISVEPVASSNRIKTQRKCSKRAWRKGRAEFLMVPPVTTLPGP